MRILATGAVVFLLDLISKRAVQALMVPHQTIEVIPKVFSLTYVLNPGAAFGLFAYRTNYFILVTVAVVALIVVYGKKLAAGRWLLEMSFGLQLGGAVGNLIDRVGARAVVDFLDFHVWPVFNVADMAIVIGVGLFTIEAFSSRGAGRNG